MFFIVAFWRKKVEYIWNDDFGKKYKELNFQHKTIVVIFPALLSGEAPTIFSVREKEAI